MGFTLGSLIVPLIADTSKFKEGIDSAKNSANSLSSSLSSIGGGVVLGALGMAAAGIGALGVATVKGIDAASNLSETINKTTVVFGDASKSILEFSKNADKSLGQSQQAALNAASTFGVFGKSANLTGGDLSKFSVNLVSLASDLASFHNTSPEEAVNALSAALRGESEPLRRYGILLDDASMRQKALELGLIKTTKDALTPQQKVLAANALIMEQSKDAQGDFARTSDGLANSQRIFAAQTENLTALWGKAFLPIMEQGYSFLNNVVFPGLTIGVQYFSNIVTAYLPVVIETFQNIFTFLQNNEGILVGVLAAMGVAVLSFGFSVASAAITAMLPLLPVIAVLGLVGVAAYALYEAWKNNFGGIQEKTTGLWNNLQPILSNLQNWFKESLPVAIKFLQDAWNNAVLLFTVGQIWFTANLLPTLQSLGNLISLTLTASFKGLVLVWDNALHPALLSLWKIFNENILPTLKTVGAWMVDNFAGQINNLKGVIDILCGALQWLNQLFDSLSGKKVPDVPTGGGSGNTTQNANGGTAQFGDMQWVGENGPELLSLPVGTRINSNSASNGIMNNTAELLQQILTAIQNNRIDEAKLARSIRDNMQFAGG